MSRIIDLQPMQAESCLLYTFEQACTFEKRKFCRLQIEQALCPGPFQLKTPLLTVRFTKAAIDWLASDCASGAAILLRIPHMPPAPIDLPQCLRLDLVVLVV